MVDEKYSFKKFSDKRESIVTTIDSNLKFPESMERNASKYLDQINEFFSILNKTKVDIFNLFFTFSFMKTN